LSINSSPTPPGKGGIGREGGREGERGGRERGEGGREEERVEKED